MSYAAKRTILLLLTFAALAALFWVSPASRSVSEPVIAGQPLSVHLRNQTYGDVRIDRAAKEAIRDLGSNAVPHLIRILEARESRFTAALRTLAQKQPFFRVRFTPLSVRQNDAALACEELGPVAAAATPALSRLVHDPVLAPAAIAALAQIGPQNLSLLTQVLQNGPDNARMHAAGHLRHLQPSGKVVATLTAAMKDPSPLVRSRAAESLGTFECEARTIVPILTTALDDESPLVRASAAQSLGWIGREAAPALPKLLEKLKTEDGEDRHFADAVRAIDPRSAERP